ncbi:SCO family protein [Vitreimonas sp.]|jgi:protein SCO1/2|uniref:SCO family protein n=1 Tax=Vitreimonas sp. TaxID=3069702 RepID=UPI002ED94AE2
MAEPVETPRRNLTGAVVPAVAAAALAAVGTLLLVGRNGGEKAPETPVVENCIIEGADVVNGPIELLDSNGATVTQADFAGEPAVVYFGFTHCPDICPTSMYTLAAALAEPGGYDVQPILISLDPERDTPEVMGAYVQTGGFPPGLVGLTGSRAQVDAAKASFHVYSARAPIEGAPEDVYNVDHSSFLYVLDGQWRTRSIVNTVQATPQQVAQCIAAGLERAG